MFLTREELYELTELKKPCAQRRWLENNGYPFDVSVSGRPKVLKDYLQQRLSNKAGVASSQEPNFAALG